MEFDEISVSESQVLDIQPAKEIMSEAVEESMKEAMPLIAS